MTVWHARLRRDLGEHVDGRLPPRRRARLVRHLAGCAACRRELRELERTVALLRSLPRPELPPEASARLIAHVAAHSAAQPAAPALRAARWIAPVAAAAAAVALLTVVQGIEISVVLPGWAASEASPPAAEAPRRAREAAPPTVPGPRAAFRVADAGAGRPAVLGAAAAAEPHPAPSRARALERPLPPLAACASSGADEQACARWHSWLVGLAMRDPSAFVVEVEALPSGVRERWLGEMSRFAAHAGAASLLAAELRATGDPKASSLARRFERTTTVVSRR